LQKNNGVGLWHIQGHTCITQLVIYTGCGFSGLGVSVLAFSTQVRGFKPGQSRRSHVTDLRHAKDP